MLGPGLLKLLDYQLMQWNVAQLTMNINKFAIHTSESRLRKIGVSFRHVPGNRPTHTLPGGGPGARAANKDIRLRMLDY